MKRWLVIIGVALAVFLPGVLLVRLWPAWHVGARPAQAPSMRAESASVVQRPAGPLDAFDIRDVGKGPTRIKLWVTPPGTKTPFGVEFTGKGPLINAVVSKHAAAGATSVPLPPAWVDRLNAAVRRSPALPGVAASEGQGNVLAELVWETPGEVPRKFELAFDPQGAGWAVLDEVISNYGFVPYTVKKGDTPVKIAQKMLGDPRRWPEIVAANPGMKPDKLVPGDLIKVPKK